MNCSHFHSHIHLLFDRESLEQSTHAMHLHMKECSDCAAYYLQCKHALAQLTPRIDLHAPESLKTRILEAAAVQAKPQSTRRGLIRPLLAAAALIALVIILIDPVQSIRAHATQKLFRNAAIGLSQNRGLYMEIDVRTLPNENFAQIDSRLPFVTHRLWIVPGKSEKWRFEKPGRIAVSDSTSIRAWMPFAQTGWLFAPGSNVIEGFHILLNPEGLMRWEEAYANKNPKAAYRKQVGAEIITLTVDTPAKGDFANAYLRNTSIETSDSRREYQFDRTTGHLTGMKIATIVNNKATCVIELKNINYDTLIPDSLFTIPEGIDWIDLSQPIGSSDFTNITAEQAATRLIKAMQTWDMGTLRAGMPSYNLDQLRAEFAGARLIKTEEAFHSGDYPGVFVPCTVVLSNTTTVRMILALRNDNQAGAWVVDGGI